MKDAETMVRDYIALDLEVDPSSFAVEITPELGGGLDEEIRATRAATVEAASTVAVAAKRARETARRPRYRRHPRGVAAASVAAPKQLTWPR